MVATYRLTERDVVQTLQLVLSESQYERLRHEAERRHISMTDLAVEAIEAFLRLSATEHRYVRLARKQALWRTYQPGLPGAQLVREQPATYAVEPDRSIHARLDDLRLDLVYHSEALEGSPLTRDQVKDAIRGLPTQ